MIRSVVSVILLLIADTESLAQEYRNLDGGRPVRIEDASPTERYGLDLDFSTIRFDRMSSSRARFQFEPSASYGMLPNTEFSVRVPVFIRERNQNPRAGISGIGTGVMHQLRLETLRVPAIAVAIEAFIPTGSAATRTAYSAKALTTKSFSAGRLHVNASYGSYSIRIPPRLVVTQCTPGPGVTCADPSDLPPIDFPCAVSPSKGELAVAHLSMLCTSSKTPSFRPSSQALGTVVTNDHWVVGVAADRAIPLRSILLIADIFAEHFDGFGRPVDWTAEVGARRQVYPWLVVDGAIGRHYFGRGLSTFVTFGTTVSRPLP